MNELTYFVNKNGAIFVFNHKTEQRLSLISLLEDLGCKYYLDEESATRKSNRILKSKKTEEDFEQIIHFAFDHQEKRIKTYLKGFVTGGSFPFYLTVSEKEILGFNDQESYIDFLSQYEPNLDLSNLAYPNVKLLTK